VLMGCSVCSKLSSVMETFIVMMGQMKQKIDVTGGNRGSQDVVGVIRS
jgi:hypothetical protein